MNGIVKLAPSDQAVTVLQQAGEWKVFRQNRVWRRFDHRIDAEEAAVRLQAQARSQGHDIDVLVQSPFGELERLTS